MLWHGRSARAVADMASAPDLPHGRDAHATFRIRHSAIAKTGRIRLHESRASGDFAAGQWREHNKPAAASIRGTRVQESMARFFTPLSLGRLWATLAWSLTLAVLLAGADWTERQFAQAAAARVIVLSPVRALEEPARREWTKKLSSEPGVAGVHWLSPRQMARQMAGQMEGQMAARASRRLSEPQGEEMFGGEEDEGWLPWVAEVGLRDPLGRSDLAGAFVARRQQEGQWQAVLWDGEWLNGAIQARMTVRVLLGVWLALAALTGAAVLLRVPWPRQGGLILWFWSAALGAAAPAAVWAAAWLAGGALADARAGAVAAAAGLILASLAAPMIRQRKPRAAVPPAEPPRLRAVA
jgi:hypothetical protein